MNKPSRVITVKGAEVAIATRHEQDYISLTDMLRNFGDESILYNWLRNRNTIEFLGICEQLYNPGFKPLEFDRFRNQAGQHGGKPWRYLLIPHDAVAVSATLAALVQKFELKANLQVASESAIGLAKLGGSEPQLTAVPRRH